MGAVVFQHGRGGAPFFEELSTIITTFASGGLGRAFRGRNGYKQCVQGAKLSSGSMFSRPKNVKNWLRNRFRD